MHTTHGGGEHECSDIGDSSSRLCGEVVFGGTAGGVVVEGLGDNTQRLGMVEDTHWGTSSQAAISVAVTLIGRGRLRAVRGSP